MNDRRTIRLLKEAVLKFRIAELKECYKMVGEKYKQFKKAEMQKTIIIYIDVFQNMKIKMPLSFIQGIFRLERGLNQPVKKRRRQKMQVQSSNNLNSPFFETISVLKTIMISSTSTISLEIPNDQIHVFRKRKNKTCNYDIQLKFTVSCSEEWNTPTIRYKVNGSNYLENEESPPLLYIASYCSFRKWAKNKIEVEFPFTDQEYELTISIVKRILPSELLEMKPVREVKKHNELMKKYFDENNAYICEVVLICPIERKIMRYPSRSSHCNHLEVFDLETFLGAMQYFLTWNCPICRERVTYDSLEIESFFKRMIDNRKVKVTFFKKPEIRATYEAIVSCSSEFIVID